jgi:hypothetical protein
VIGHSRCRIVGKMACRGLAKYDLHPNCGDGRPGISYCEIIGWWKVVCSSKMLRTFFRILVE